MSPGNRYSSMRPDSSLPTHRNHSPISHLCMQKLSKLQEAMEEDTSPIMRQVFEVLFPFKSPGWNSGQHCLNTFLCTPLRCMLVLATFYISSVPNFILAFIPAEINADTLNTMTAFAVQSPIRKKYLCQYSFFFRQVCQCVVKNHWAEYPRWTAERCISAFGPAFVHGRTIWRRCTLYHGRREAEHYHRVSIRIVISFWILVNNHPRLAIFIGFASFFIMEKTLRVLGGDDSEAGHSHSHSHSHSAPAPTANSSAIAASSKSGIRSRGVSEKVKPTADEVAPAATSPSKLSAYLNLFGDFVHNM